MTTTPNYLKSVVEELLQSTIEKTLKESARTLYGNGSVDILLASQEETMWVQKKYSSFDTQVLRKYYCSNTITPCTHDSCSHPLQREWIVRFQNRKEDGKSTL